MPENTASLQPGFTPSKPPIHPTARGHAHGNDSAALQVACTLVLALTVAFNPMLAIANASVMPVGGALVALVQGILVVAALLLGLHSWRAGVQLWVGVAWFLALASMGIAVVRAQFDPKSFGDVLLIPAFIMLGMQIRPRILIRTVLALQMVILIAGIWELADPAGFGAFFKVASYYINSRGYSADEFWAGGDLFVSSMRPHGRMLLSDSGLHRGSSLFLEPVSLGNWTIMITLFTAGLWQRLKPGPRFFLIISNVVLLVICDGRLALGVNLMLLVYLPLARRIPGWISVVYLPVSVLLLMVARQLGLLAEAGDTLVGRLRYGIDAMSRLDMERVLAIGQNRLGNEDAGLVFFIQNQSMPVAIGLWMVVTLTSIGESSGARAFKHGMALFLMACLPISNASLSIKTTALMWACFGYFYARAHLSSIPASGLNIPRRAQLAYG